MPELVYCDMRGVDVHESFCYGCAVPEREGVTFDNCPFIGTAQEELI